jgi:hydrogenase expression/formation protein HypC
MCLAIPSKIVRIEEMTATVDVYGARREISLMLMPEEVSMGDYVLVHAGFAIQKVDGETANDALALLREVLEQFGEEEDPY